MDTFIGVSKGYEELINDLVAELFGVEVTIQIYVLPPEAGSLRQVLGVVLIAGMGGILGTGGWEMTRGFTEGLTGLPPEEWSRQLGENLREVVESEENAGEVNDEELQQVTEVTSTIVEVSRHIVSTPTERLASQGFEPSQYPETFNAKSDMFYQIEVDPQIRGVGFGHEREAPIRREDFGRYQLSARKEEDPEEWRFELVRYRVSSPNWDRFDSQRKWKGRDQEGSIVYFTITDGNFWEMARHGELESNVIDELIAQVATKYVDGKRTDRVVISVIRFNDRPVSPELTRTQLGHILDLTVKDIGEGTNSLFDDDL
ncbi:hypothetical protein [Jannaschia sp. CCS1]|uniref:hypothetical protein n=1 Tax=Jannaschia sp. (strain CCS1) TaxID=290400 RepID=UPI0005C66A05|nr:hypothetical protein [Jannaschia sp. CCS1]